MNSYFNSLLASRLKLTKEQLEKEEELRNNVLSHITPRFLNNREVLEFFSNPFDTKKSGLLIGRYASHMTCLDDDIQSYKKFLISAVCKNNIEKRLDDLADVIDDLADVKDVVMGDPVPGYGEFVEIRSVSETTNPDLALATNIYNSIRDCRVIGVTLYTPDGQFLMRGGI